LRHVASARVLRCSTTLFATARVGAEIADRAFDIGDGKIFE